MYTPKLGSRSPAYLTSGQLLLAREAQSHQFKNRKPRNSTNPHFLQLLDFSRRVIAFLRSIEELEEEALIWSIALYGDAESLDALMKINYSATEELMVLLSKQPLNTYIFTIQLVNSSVRSGVSRALPHPNLN